MYLIFPIKFSISFFFLLISKILKILKLKTKKCQSMINYLCMPLTFKINDVCVFFVKLINLVFSFLEKKTHTGN